MPANRKQRWIGGALILTLVALAIVGQWRIAMQHGQVLAAHVRYPRGVMGTESVLVVVQPREEGTSAEETLRAAEAELRQVEARMSNWLDRSEVSRLCGADADVQIPLSDDTRHVLQLAREAYAQTGGAFDVTCHPLLELWRRAERNDRCPKASEVAAARAASRWSQLDQTASGVVKSDHTAGVDLGGIAKGYAIDRALQAMKQTGAGGGLVDVGGDLACFGSQPDGRPWLVDVQDPQAGAGGPARLRIRDAAVATSGDYARYFEIQGKRYSQIIDPRSGQPAAAARSVTVVAPSAVVADVWATALSVLGLEGLERLPEDVEALIVAPAPSGPRYVCTPGFAERVEPPIPGKFERRSGSRQGFRP